THAGYLVVQPEHRPIRRTGERRHAPQVDRRARSITSRSAPRGAGRWPRRTSGAGRAGRERNGDRMTTGYESIAEIDQDAETRCAAVTPSKRPIRLVRGEGALVFDDQGNRYIDCVGGIAVANVGHANPRVVAAITQQAARLISCPELFHNDARSAYLERLVAALPAGMNRVFLCNSGTEAVEAAIKFARFATGRTQILAAMRGFHVRTLGALSATWERAYRAPFEPLVPDYAHARYNDAAALDAAITEHTAAVLLEVVQGEGGVRPAT